MAYIYEYPHAALTVDLAVFRKGSKGAEVLLIKRKNPPFAGCWALPGGFIDENERLIEAASRELEEETGLKDLPLTPGKVYDDPARDPRHRTISFVFSAQAPAGTEPYAGDDAERAAFFPLEQLPELAFDHSKILSDILDNQL